MSNDSPASDTEMKHAEDRVSLTIDREMYEELRDRGCYIGEDMHGTPVHISEDFRSVTGRDTKEDDPHPGAWSPVFEVDDSASQLDETKPVADSRSKKTLLEATTGDLIQVRKVHSGMWKTPEKFEVTGRTNTYFGPVLKLKAPDDYEGEQHGYELTCPGPDSHPLVWKAVTDPDGFVQSRSKVAKVSVEIFNVAGYDFCDQCGDPIKDPMHRSLAMTGQCPGGMNNAE